MHQKLRRAGSGGQARDRAARVSRRFNSDGAEREGKDEGKGARFRARGTAREARRLARSGRRRLRDLV